MSQVVPKDNKEQIMAAFAKLLTEKKKSDSKVATKEEEAEKAKNKQLVEVASTYTIDSIVKGMADLQLDFGGIINGLSERLATESSKLDELKRAIAIETYSLQELRQIRLVADALDILTQEHQEKLQFLENNAAAQREAVEKEISQNRKQWQKEQQNFEESAQEAMELLAKERQGESADYDYEIQRLRQVEMDDYEEAKRQQERELQGLKKEKEKDWAVREKLLSDRQAELAEYQQKIAGFEEELKQAYTKAKEEAIKDADREAKVKSDLLEKEWESTQQGYDLQIQALDSTIERQNQQIAGLTAQLQEAMRQAQDLAMRAFQSSGNGRASNQ